MRELTYYVAVSLDGRIAAPDGDFSAFPVEGDHMAALFRDWRDTLPSHVLAALGLEADGTRFDTVLMGWDTYAVGLEQGFPSPYSHLRQVVFSRARKESPHPEVQLTDEDPAAVVRRLKAEEGGGIWLCGGGRLAGALAPEIDRLVLKVNPVLLGEGIPLLAGDHDPQAFVLETSTPYASGVVVNEYRRA